MLLPSGSFIITSHVVTKCCNNRDGKGNRQAEGSEGYGGTKGLKEIKLVLRTENAKYILSKYLPC